jgi:hypothetical protein
MGLDMEVLYVGMSLRLWFQLVPLEFPHSLGAGALEAPTAQRPFFKKLTFNDWTTLVV